MEGEIAKFVEASKAFQNPATSKQAEEYLTSLEKSPHALELAKAIFDSSTQQDPLFFGAVLIRKVILASWSSVPTGLRTTVRDFLFDFMVKRFSDLSPPVRNQICIAYAVIWKRGWLDRSSSENDLLLRNLESIANGSPLEKFAALLLMQALIDEFGSQQSSALGLTLEFHRKCFDLFEKQHLTRVMSLGLSILEPVAKKALEELSKVSLPEVCRRGSADALPQLVYDVLGHSLKVINKVLSWPFRKFVSSSGNSTFQSIAPGEQWGPILSSPALTGMLFDLYGRLRYLHSTNLPHSLRQILLQLSSLTGNVFDEPTKCSLVERMISGLLKVINTPYLGVVLKERGVSPGLPSKLFAARFAENAGIEAAKELGDMCQCFYRLWNFYTPPVFVRIADLPGAIKQLTTITEQCWKDASDTARAAVEVAKRVRSGEIDDGEATIVKDYLDMERTCILEAVEHLLEFWNSVLIHRDSIPQGYRAGFMETFSAVYDASVKERLSIALGLIAAGENDDDPFEDETALQSHMELVAAVGRANIGHSLRAMHDMVNASHEKLKGTIERRGAGASAGVEGMDLDTELSCHQEELFWLLMFIGYLISDADDSERPLVPAAILEYESQVAGKEVGASPVAQTVDSIFRLIDYEWGRLLASQAGQGMSPLTCAQFLWFLQRWSATYLMPDLSLYTNKPFPMSLSRVYGGAMDKPASQLLFLEGAENIAEFIVQKAAIGISLWCAEQEVVTNGLQCLQAIVKNRTVAGIAVATPAWKLLVKCFVAGIDGNTSELEGQSQIASLLSRLRLLPPDHRGSLFSILISSTACLPDGEKKDYFGLLVQPLQNQLQRMMSSSDFPKVAFTSETQEKVLGLLHLYQGAVKAVPHLPEAVGHHFMMPALQALSKLITLYKIHEVSYVCLKIMRKYVESQAILLPAAPLGELCQVCKDMFVSSSKHGLPTLAGESLIGKEKKVGGKSDMDASYKTILQLVRILDGLARALNAKDLFQEAAAWKAGEEGDVIVEGLRVIIPWMSPQHLNYPKLCQAYLNVCLHLLHSYPEKVATMDPSMFEVFLNTLRFGIQHPRPEFVRRTLEALLALCIFHSDAMKKGEAGLRNHLQRNPALFRGFIELLFRVLFTPSTPQEIVTPGANAVLGLAVCDVAAYKSFVEDLTRRQESESAQQRLGIAFTHLMEDNGIGMSLDKRNRTKFQHNFRLFVDEVQSFLVVK